MTRLTADLSKEVGAFGSKKKGHVVVVVVADVVVGVVVDVNIFVEN